MRKYKLRHDMVIVLKDNRILYRIQALRDFGNVKEGDLGGWVESEENLSHEGNCWVYEDAKVYGRARVFGDAKVHGRARVFGDAKVYGQALVCGYSEVFERALVHDYARVYGKAHVCGDARVFGETTVSGDANVSGKDTVSGDTNICVNESSHNDAEVHGDVKNVTDYAYTGFCAPVYGLPNLATPVRQLEHIEGIDDGGERISYGEGRAVREPAKGKGRYDLITPFGLARLAKWYELGAQKYSDRNWEKGIPYSRYTDSALRHITKFIMGMDDEDHLAAACWNLMAIMHHQEVGQTELDDMPHYVQKEKK